MSIETPQPQAKVFLVDDHALVREQLTALIQVEADLTVCGDAEDAPTALSLINRLQPDVVILDISLKRSNGLDLLEDLRKSPTPPAVLVLSMHDDRFYVARALRAGARGYITKEDAATKILPAIRQVLGGGLYLSDRVAGQVWDRVADRARAVAGAVHA